MARLKQVVEVTFTEDDHEMTDLYYLLHFGLKYDLVMGYNGESIGVNYTVAICQHLKTGQIELFFPEQLKVIGNEKT